ncbi:MAG: hypothetical protein ABSG45_02010 [Nitrososphaerales archaeon]|jgi:hypothetical protein
MTSKEKISGFFHSKIGKILPILLIALLIGSASSTVYVYYIGNATGTVKTSDMLLRAGTDSSASCTTSWPCATVTPVTSSDYETIAFSLFPSVASAVQPATYYSNLTTIQNHGTVSHSLKAVDLYNFGGTPGLSALGKIVVYYCTTQTEFNPDGTLVTPANCLGSATIISTTSGVQVVSGAFPSSLAANAKGYIELSAYALNTATAGNTVMFTISFQWL